MVPYQKEGVNKIATCDEGRGAISCEYGTRYEMWGVGRSFSDEPCDHPAAWNQYHRRCGGGGAEAEVRKSTSQEARSQNHRKHGARIIGSTEPESHTL